MLCAFGDVGTHEDKQACRRAHGQRVGPDGWPIQVGVDEEDDQGDMKLT
jgi:hypothetical protein